MLVPWLKPDFTWLVTFSVQDQLPELYNHFQAQGIATSMFASSWFLALFTTVLPLPLACRVFDLFLYEVGQLLVC